MLRVLGTTCLSVSGSAGSGYQAGRIAGGSMETGVFSAQMQDSFKLHFRCVLLSCLENCFSFLIGVSQK